MTTVPSVRLRPATPEDRFLIRRWLAGSGVQESWGGAASAEAEITLAMETAAALSRIIERDGAPVGYAHAVEIGVWVEKRPVGVPAGAWRVAYILASAEDNCPRLGEFALALLTREVFATTLAVACSAVVSIRNEEAVRAYERAGFRWLQVSHDAVYGPSWVMLKERPLPPPAR